MRYRGDRGRNRRRRRSSEGNRLRSSKKRLRNRSRKRKHPLRHRLHQLLPPRKELILIWWLRWQLRMLPTTFQTLKEKSITPSLRTPRTTQAP
jgi:hypothetical protein